MISGRDRIFYDEFSDCHDKIVVVGVDFIGRRTICGFICKGGGASGSPLRGKRLQVIDLIVDGRGEEFKVLRW